MNKNEILSVQYEQLFDVGTLFFTIKIFNLTKNKTAHAKGRQNVSGSRWLINFPVH